VYSLKNKKGFDDNSKMSGYSDFLQSKMYLGDKTTKNLLNFHWEHFGAFLGYLGDICFWEIFKVLSFLIY
jgi:hypothetical protein